MRAATRVNAEQSSKRTMCRSTRQRYRGRLIRLGEMSDDDAQSLHRGLAAARTQGKRAQHGKPHGVVRDDQPDAREGLAEPHGVAERFVVPLKPDNAGGGKGPQFKTDARRSEGPGDWATSHGELRVKSVFIRHVSNSEGCFGIRSTSPIVMTQPFPSTINLICGTARGARSFSIDFTRVDGAFICTALKHGT